MPDLHIEGTCDARFARVKEAFAENFAKRNEYGAAVAVTIAGKPVIDLWAGHADKARTHPWTRDTLVNVFSTTKGLTAICAHRLADQGKLDFDAPVVRYWPEFAQKRQRTDYRAPIAQPSRRTTRHSPSARRRCRL